MDIINKLNNLAEKYEKDPGALGNIIHSMSSLSTYVGFLSTDTIKNIVESPEMYNTPEEYKLAFAQREEIKNRLLVNAKTAVESLNYMCERTGFEPFFEGDIDNQEHLSNFALMTNNELCIENRHVRDITVAQFDYGKTIAETTAVPEEYKENGFER